MDEEQAEALKERLAEEASVVKEVKEMDLLRRYLMFNAVTKYYRDEKHAGERRKAASAFRKGKVHTKASREKMSTSQKEVKAAAPKKTAPKKK